MGNDVVVAALFIFIGVVLGLMGSGGSIVTLPVLTYLAGFPPDQAVPATLVIVGVASAIGAALYYRQGYFEWKVTLWLGLAGMPGAYLGAGLTARVSDQWLMLLFALVMIAAGVSMLRRRDRPPTRRGSMVLLGGLGLTIGVLAGFLGVGGGFLIVPALVVIAGIQTRRAIAASLGVISLNAMAGVAGHLGAVEVPMIALVAFVPLASAGIWIGTSLTGRLAEATIRVGFACVVIAIGLAIAGTNLG
jgi:hypothetical protein